ncbi:MAG: SpoIIE family protein phosphatase, partial [Bacteroidota bacterium]|nr:SpoIIE family protein phosphatase [Bacteroidota bacterium]
MEKNELEFAGAYNPLYLIRNNELIVTKADRFAIGWTSSESGQKFTSHKIKLEKGDTTYIFSDGFADQFGGEIGKKFMIRNLKKLLLDIQDLSMKEQKTRLEETFETWRGNEEQIDDVIIIGTRYE